MYELVKGTCKECDLVSDCRNYKFNYIGPDYNKKMKKACKEMKHYNCETKEAIKIHFKILKKAVWNCGGGRRIKISYYGKRRF